MKGVLVISYYWPPSGGPGAQRVVKFVRYLPWFGWEPIVLTVEKGEFPYHDPSLAEDVPEDLPVFRARSVDPFAIYKKFTGRSQAEGIPVGLLTHRPRSFKERLATAVRSNVFIPDARIGWVPFARRKAMQIIRRYPIDLVFVSSPPHSSQLIGTYIKKKVGIPYVADLRDPWTDIRYYQFVQRSHLTRKLDARLERKVLETADAITTVSRDLVRLFNNKTSRDITAKSYVLPNGYDELDFLGLTYQRSTRFTILHTGNMQEHQNPELLWRVLEDLFHRQPELREKLRVQLIGRVHPAVQEAIRQHQLQDVVEFLPFQPHNEIVKRMKQADLLLMVIPRVENNLGIVTGKFFEYLGSNRPVLVIGPPQSDAGRMLAPVEGSKIVDYEDVTGLRDYLKNALSFWEQRIWDFDNSQYVERFSRKKLTHCLVDIFDRLTHT